MDLKNAKSEDSWLTNVWNFEPIWAQKMTPREFSPNCFCPFFTLWPNIAILSESKSFACDLVPDDVEMMMMMRDDDDHDDDGDDDDGDDDDDDDDDSDDDDHDFVCFKSSETEIW